MGKRADKSTGAALFTSSIPVAFPKEQEALFREVLTVFETMHLPFAVGGAFALRKHTGISRSTKDLDVFLCPQDASDALARLQEHGFECEITDSVWLAKARHAGHFVDLITGMSNGVIGVEPSWIERACPAKILGINTRVLAAEELLASKLFVTRRERFDGADIAHIIFASRGKLQWNRVLQLAGEHWELLLWALVLFHYVYPARSSECVPHSLWQDLLIRLGKEVSFPNPDARFRGSLIDDAMFSIDVQEWGLDDVLAECRARRAKITFARGSRCG